MCGIIFFILLTQTSVRSWSGHLRPRQYIHYRVKGYRAQQFHQKILADPIYNFVMNFKQKSVRNVPHVVAELNSKIIL